MPTGTPSHHVSVAGVVVNDAGDVLLAQRRDNGHWEAPGGVLELDETFEAGVAREVLEETGVMVTVGPLTGVYKNMTLGVVALVYRCEPVGGNPRHTDESTDVRWIDPDRIESLMTPAFAVRVRDALRNDAAPASRAHDGTIVRATG
jgi:8-oxo-dGTP pyrophosphatase MutT (NUDIX family)